MNSSIKKTCEMNLMLFFPVLVIVLFQRLKASQAWKCEYPISPEEIAGKEKCLAELGSKPSWECQHVCMLKQMGVIKEGRVMQENWKPFIQKKFPLQVQVSLIQDLLPCSKLYSAYQQNKRCDENNAFYRCYDDAVDKACL